MKRKPLSTWAWSAYNPSKALPEELEFILLDKDERRFGTIVYTRVNFLKGSEMNTPWGPARGAFGTWKGGFKIHLNDRELVELDSRVFSKRMELRFPSGATMIFMPRRGYKNDLEFTSEEGYFGVFEEKGFLPDGLPSGRPQPTKEEIKMLPKDQRPRSIETREYKQFRLRTSGVLPVKVEDAVASVAIFATFGCLIEELPA